MLSEPPLHRARSLLIAVPLTHTDRGWSTHVNLTPGETSVPVAMCEQVKSMSTTRVTRVEPVPYRATLGNEVHDVLTLLTSAR